MYPSSLTNAGKFAENFSYRETHKLFADAFLGDPKDFQERFQRISSGFSDWQQLLTSEFKNRKIAKFSKMTILSLNSEFKAEVDMHNSIVEKENENLKQSIITINNELSSTQRDISNIIKTTPYDELSDHQKNIHDNWVEHLNSNFQLLEECKQQQKSLYKITLKKQPNEWIQVDKEAFVTMGWIPSADRYVNIQCTDPPTEGKLEKYYALEIYSGSINVQLTLLNLIYLSNKILLSDEQFRNAILTFIKQKKQESYINCSNFAGLEELFMHLTMTINGGADIDKTSLLLANFNRPIGEPFLECIQRFSSLSKHLSLLMRPVMKSIEAINLKEVTDCIPFLLSTEGSMSFIHYKADLARQGEELDITKIMAFCLQLERDPNMLPTSVKTLPAHLGYQCLTKAENYDTKTTEQTALMVKSNKKANESYFVPQRNWNSGRNGKQEKERRSRPEKKQTYQQPRRDSSASRSASPASIKSSSSRGSSNKSLSPFRPRQTRSRSSSLDPRVPRVFRGGRQSPESEDYLKDYFSNLKTTKYLDWKQTGRCCKCYSKDHRGSKCTKFGSKIILVPCLHCGLFHSEKKCPFNISKSQGN